MVFDCHKTLWATPKSNITQLKIKQLGFFIPLKNPFRVNRVSTDFHFRDISLTPPLKIIVIFYTFFFPVDTANPPFDSRWPPPNGNFFCLYLWLNNLAAPATLKNLFSHEPT